MSKDAEQNKSLGKGGKIAIFACVVVIILLLMIILFLFFCRDFVCHMDLLISTWGKGGFPLRLLHFIYPFIDSVLGHQLLVGAQLYCPASVQH